jgi:hypothetical protein
MVLTPGGLFKYLQSSSMVARDKRARVVHSLDASGVKGYLSTSMMWYVFTREEIEDAKRLQYFLY